MGLEKKVGQIWLLVFRAYNNIITINLLLLISTIFFQSLLCYILSTMFIWFAMIFFFKIAKISNMLAIYTGDVLCYRYWSLPGETVTENYTTGKIPHHPQAQKGDHGN